MPQYTDVRILVAEDNPVNQKLALRQLEKLGYGADMVSNGIEVVLALDEKRYDLILMDCQMPEMDGYEATREIRQREGNARRTPIVALTADALESDRERCIAAGMDDYLSKPLRESELAAVLKRWLTHPLDPAVLDNLRQLSKGSDEFLREVTTLYLADSPLRLEAIRKAVQANDSAALAAAAHALKGSSGNVGAKGVQELAARIERIARAGKIDGALTVVDELTRECERAQERLRELIE